MGIKNNIVKFREELRPYRARLVAVSKTHPSEKIKEALEAGQDLFGENKVQEMLGKQLQLPAEAKWHLIGHLQRNKVRFITPFIDLIHSVDSLKLLQEINKEGQKINRVVHCLLQVYIAREETKFGLDPEELRRLLDGPELVNLKFVSIDGLMGMATLTENQTQIKGEFRTLRKLFEELRSAKGPQALNLRELSMGMSSDYKIALDEGSTLVRIGTAIFGEREYPL